jgi:pyridoxamine 5'-phosphate oxidase-like protein
MGFDDRAVRALLRQAKVARIATLSRSGRPSLTSIYFVAVGGHVWLGTASWTLAAREAQADPRVSLLFNLEREPDDQRVLRVAGQAVVRTGAAAVRAYGWRVALKYVARPGYLLNQLAHRRQLALVKRYHAQSRAKGTTAIIDVTPEQFEWLEV